MKIDRMYANKFMLSEKFINLLHFIYFLPAKKDNS